MNRRGFIDGKGWTGFLICLMLLSAFIGWGLIEGFLWVVSHISVCV